jgi:dual specificity MAP kinase phosphatase
MLEALGISHVVSVGETLISCPRDCDPMYGKIGANALVNAYQDGKIKVSVQQSVGSCIGADVIRLDILAIRDDGNDPLRPTIANACDWIEKARLDGGKVLVHCVSSCP